MANTKICNNCGKLVAEHTDDEITKCVDILTSPPEDYNELSGF